jgi:hypothetical protein
MTLAAGAWGAAGPAAAEDLIEHTKRVQTVAAQKVEADVQLALRESARLLRTDPDEAVTKLKATLTQVQQDQVLTAERREALVRVLKDRVRIAEAGADAAAEQDAAREDEEARAEAKKEGQQKQAAETAKVKAGLEAVTNLRRDGKNAEAKKKADELLRDYPANVAVQVLNGVSVSAGHKAENDALRKDKEQRTVAALRDIDRSALIATNDVEFPKDWKEKTARRKAANALSPTERALLQTLERPIDVKFKGSKLQDAIEYLSTVTGQTILLEKSALDEAQVTYDTPVNYCVRAPIATRAALRAVLSSVGLTYVVQGDVIQVTTPGRAKDMMITKTYYIGDIVTGIGLVGGSAQYGHNLDQMQLAQNVGGIVEMLKQTVDPQSWEAKGGPGAIGFNIPTMSLVIRQSAEVHAMIRNSLFK